LVATDTSLAVRTAAQAAAAAASALALAPESALDDCLRATAKLLRAEATAILEANQADLAAGEESLSTGLLDRLRLGEERLEEMSRQQLALAALPHLEAKIESYPGPEGMIIEARRIPAGVIGAIYEARGTVTVEIASQLIKSRNAGVLRSGTAALRTASALVRRVLHPALAQAGLPPAAIQLLEIEDRTCAEELVSIPDLVPIVIIRGSGPTTAALSRRAAAHNVHALAHADGGGVLYIHPSADPRLREQLIRAGLDRLAVCNRLNLLLIDQGIWERFLPQALEVLEQIGIRASLPPHDHDLGYEWAADAKHQATVTIAPADGPENAASIANEKTSGIAAAIAAEDGTAARKFLERCRGTGVFWNVTTRLLDGYRLTGAPETGINTGRTLGPRGPVTYRDLFLRQYRVVSSSRVEASGTA
jgi:glutamate-5-semialdehyde dehydrogenase